MAPPGSGGRGQGMLAALVRITTKSLFSVLFPANCRFCEAPLQEVSRVPVCADCLEAIQPIQGILCACCGERLVSAQMLASAGVPAPWSADSQVAEGQRCGMCQRSEPPFVKAAAYGSYDAGMRELIHLLKYEGVRPAAAVLGRMLAEVIARLAPQFDKVPLVVPVPLHSSKLRQRGFNQSELIARAALKLHPTDLELEIQPGILIRHRATESQTGLTPEQRRANMRGAFRVIDPAAVIGRDILLVDDVYTTGTTVSECARVLRKAGAERVWVATVARVLKPEVTWAQPPREPVSMLVMAAKA